MNKTDKVLISKQKRNKKTQKKDDTLLSIMGELSYCEGKNGLYAKLPYTEKNRIININSKEYIDYVSSKYYVAEHKFIEEKEIRDRLKLIRYFYIDENQSDSLYMNRYIYEDGNIYIDMANDKLEYIKVTPKGYRVIRDTEGSTSFMYKSMQEAMEYPIESENDTLLQDLDVFLNLPEDDKFLVKIWLLSCMNPNINTPILNLLGGAGGGKSSMEKMLNDIVDPSSRGLVNWDDASGIDIAIALDNSYMVCFDNVSKITNARSDMLCQSVTGGKSSCRKKYTDDCEITFDLQTRVIISSIFNCIKRTDLAQRTLFMTVPKLKTNRIREDEYVSLYQSKMGQIRGELLDILAISLEAYPQWKLEHFSKHRLASFEVYGSLIAYILEDESGIRRFKRIMKEKYLQQILLSTDEYIFINCMFSMLENEEENYYKGATKAFYDKINDWIYESPDCEYEADDIDVNYDAFCKLLHRHIDDFEVLGYEINFYSISNPHCSGIEIKKITEE